MMMKKTIISLLAVLWTSCTFAAVTVPSSATIEKWNAYFVMYSNTSSGEQHEVISEEMEVAIDGTDVYFNMLNPITGATWVKGTIANGKATFEKGQLLGNYGTSPIYMVGQDEHGICDVVYDYDEEGKRFVLDNMQVVLSGSPAAIEAWAYYVSMTVSKNGTDPQLEEELVELPDNCTPQLYVFSATSIQYNASGEVAGTEPVKWLVNVAFNGSTEVYVQGICEFLPDAWIKGTIDDGVVTFKGGQYLGKALVYPVYYYGMLVGGLTDGEFNLVDGNLAGGSYYVCINSSKTQTAPFGVYAGVTITKFNAVAATPATPSIAYYQPYNAAEGYAVIDLDIPLKDVNGEPIDPEWVSYRLWTEKDGNKQPYVFTKEKYKNLPVESMAGLPYSFSDDYDFYKGGSRIFINENLDQCSAIGVQSFYGNGGELRESEIHWYSKATLNIEASDKAMVVSETCTDLQGRRVNASTRGLIIKTQRLSDGTVRTYKVMR